MTPPAIARAILTRLLPASERDAVIGDLDEEFRHYILHAGRRSARRWYWRQALLSLPAAMKLRRRAARRRRAPSRPRSWMPGLEQDVRYAARLLVRQPGFVIMLVAMQALGIAVTTAVATLAHAVLVRPLPYAEPNRLVYAYEIDRSRPGTPGVFSWPDFVDLRESSRAFDGIAGFSGGSRTLTGAGVAERVPASEVTDGFFETLGVRPLLGTTFDCSHTSAGSPRVVILGYGAWQRRFGSDRSIVGRQITINGAAHTVLGVLPAEFEFPLRGLTELWLPLIPSRAQVERRYWHWLDAIARLAPGASAEQARAELDAFAQRLAATDPRWHEAARFGFEPLRDQIVRNVRPALLVVLVAVALVLLAACASVAGLLIARWSARAHEMGIRAAIGAGRARMVRQLLTETLLLSAAAGALGVVGGHWLLKLILASLPLQQRVTLPYADRLGLDPPAALAALLLSLIAGLVAGAAPAFAAARVDPVESLRGGGRTASPARAGFSRTVLVTAQIALAAVLLTEAALTGRSTWRLLNVSPGFDHRNLLTMRANLPDSYRTPAALFELQSRLLQRLAALPGIAGAAAINQLPLGGRGNTGLAVFDGEIGVDEAARTVAIRTVTANYFSVMGIRLVRGRSFTPADVEGSPHVVVVNRSFAERLTPGREAIGERIVFEFFPGRPKWEIVGVVGDERFEGLDRALVPVVYFPFAQAPGGSFSVVLRTTGVPESYAPAARAAAAELDPLLPLFLIRSMDQIATQSEAVAVRRQVLALLSIFGGAAVLVSTLGLYGVLAHLVAQRRREIGVRLALGATSADVIRFVMRRGLTPAAAGLGIGVCLSAAGARLGRSLLFEVSPADPLSLGAVCVVLTLVAIFACIVPAWRALRVDPVTALASD